jgi:dolichol-phosphate mannosyltransferase
MGCESTGSANPLRFVLKLVAIFFVVKFVLAYRVELIPEEAYYWNYSIHLAPGYLDHPPFSAWCIAFGNWLLGTNELGTRFATILFGCITTWLIYLLTRAVYGERAAVASIAFSTFLPFFIGNGLYASPDAPVGACWAAVLVLLVRIFARGEESPRIMDWVLLGAVFGLGLLSKYTIALLGISIALLCISRRELRVWFVRPYAYLAAIAALIVFSPVIYWNATHEWASLAFQSTRRLEEPSRFSLHQYLSYFLVLATPVAVYALYCASRRRGDRSLGASLCWFSFLVPNLVFCVFTLAHPPRFNWPGLMLISLVPIVAHGFAQALSESGVGARRLVGAWKIGLAVSVVAFLGFWVYLGFGLPGLGYGRSMTKLIGWEGLAQEISNRVSEESKATPGRVVVVGMDKHYTAAELSFYLHKLASRGGNSAPPVVGRTVFGLNSLMFDYWSREVPIGKDDTLLLVARSAQDLEMPAVTSQVASLAPVVEYRATTHGKGSGRYFYRVVRGYHPAR